MLGILPKSLTKHTEIHSLFYGNENLPKIIPTVDYHYRSLEECKSMVGIIWEYRIKVRSMQVHMGREIDVVSIAIVIWSSFHTKDI